MQQDLALLQLFLDDIRHATRLLELTETEFQALSQRDLPLLERVLAEKQPLLALLDQHGGQRKRSMTSLDLPADHQGLQRLAARSAQGEQLLQSADRLSELLERCKALNARNGRLIRANQLMVGKLLGLLRGDDHPALYDSRGATTGTSRQRPLSEA